MRKMAFLRRRLALDRERRATGRGGHVKRSAGELAARDDRALLPRSTERGHRPDDS
jgi:hypothetical protein